MKLKNTIRNIGIVAHVDAGKTTLTEQLLYYSGSSKVLGSVDKGTTYTDTLAIEKQRGISVKASEIDLTWNGTSIYLIDTPGHVDFSAEVERSIAVLDGAIIVLSSVEGVQPQTDIYFNSLQQLQKPALFFINKIDRIGASPEKVLAHMRNQLSNNLIPLQVVTENDNVFTIENLFEHIQDHELIQEIEEQTYREILEEIVSVLCENNEVLLGVYLEDLLTIGTIKEHIQLQAMEGKVYPVLYGAAIKGIGIPELLNGILTYIPGPANLDDHDFSALVYKISHDKTLGKLAHLKIISGQMQNKDEVVNYTKDSKEKINVIKKMINQKIVDVHLAVSGDLVVVSGLNCSVYDILGDKTYIPKLPQLATPVLTLKIFAKKDLDYIPLVEALTILQEEDPLLSMVWIREKKEIHIQIMGKIQLEILESILMERFDVEASFDSPSVIYKETPRAAVHGVEEYTMPKPCWAVVDFLIEPLPIGSGIVFESIVRSDKIKIQYQREIELNLWSILEQGLYGWNVTDIKITLVDGEDHVVHSRSGDFTAATAMAIMKGLKEIGTNLLEPMIHFRITVPEEICGKVINDVIQMRGTFEGPEIHGNTALIVGRLPVATSIEYPVDLSILSAGKALFSTEFAGYEPCSYELGAERERVGVNPLDRSKYILFVRSAL
ncbi:GTP-binding protein [Sporosarcina sp. FA9]|uniref:GTP-binding protein n=1 Tax=Sporosarcina sp. FA9 TaxID=3413030 RepID=UPI003F655A08